MRYCERSEAISYPSIIKKASLIACLFCISIFVQAQKNLFPGDQQKKYELLLHLQWEPARLISTSKEPASLYLQGLGNALELLVNENPTRFDVYETAFEEQLDQLQSIKKQGADVLYFETDLCLYWSFVYLKFGHELEAAFQLRKAYQLAAQGRKKYPDYAPLLKSHGLLQIIMGSVPEKYNWVLSMLNMTGNISLGLKELQQASAITSPVAVEASVVLALVQAYVLQEQDLALSQLETILRKEKDHPLASFIGASISLKNAQAEKAIQLLQPLVSTGIPSVHYFLGEAFLYKGEYEKSVAEFLHYTQTFKGENFIKDSHFKIGLCYLLLGQKNRTTSYFKQAEEKGHENTEADKYAARTLASGEALNTKLFKIRFFTDGGYYEEARETIRTVATPDLPSKKEQVEFYYRQARLAHKTNQLPAAKLFYEQCISMSGTAPWYFAPNACLQMGYILQAEGKEEEAKLYFERALSYRKHEYKNSIDAKAKSALAQGTKRK